MKLKDLLRQREPHDVIVILDAETRDVLKVGNNHCLPNVSHAQRDISRQSVAKTLQEIIGRPSIVLTGETASLLYLALSGHRLGEPPATANPMLAATARAIIERMRPVGHSWELAHQCVRVFGPVIRPWLGTTKLDEQGHPLSGTPEYCEEISLIERK